MAAVKEGREPPRISGEALQNFEVAGEDRVFHVAEAEIDDTTVVVKCPKVNNPTYVRYCWNNTPDGPNKLYNRAGFPAAPFRNYSDFELKVSGGEGSAKEVAAGAVLKISAAPENEGKPFSHWIGAGSRIKDEKAAETKINMPEHDLYLVPVYK